MINFQYAVLAEPTDIKSQAKNILVIAKWFRESEIASKLSSSTALELVSRMHGYKTYASYQADTSADYNSLVPFNQFFKPEQLSSMDQLFLRVAYTYLSNPKSNDFQYYKEPSILLFYAIDFFSQYILKTNLDVVNFQMFAFINHLGLRVTPYTNEISQQDQLFFSAKNTADLVDGLIKHDFPHLIKFLHKSENQQFLSCRIDNQDVELNELLENPDLKYSISSQINPTVSDNALKKILNAKEILSTSIYDLCTPELYRFESKSQEKIRHFGGGFNEPSDFEGISFDVYQDKQNVRFLSLDTVFEADIEYIDQDGNHKTFSFDTELGFSIHFKDTFQVKLIHSNYGSGWKKFDADKIEIAKKITLAYSNNINVLFSANQFTLFTIWSYYFHLPTSEKTLENKLFESLKCAEFFSSITLAPDLVLTYMGADEEQPQRRNKPKKEYFKLSTKNGSPIFNKIYTHKHLESVLDNLNLSIPKDCHLEKFHHR